MKTLIILILLLFLFFGCDREWNNPLITDEDLMNTPNIVQINLDSDNNASIVLDYSYSDSSTIILERKSIGGFETVNYIRKTQSTLVDTSFDKEINHTFVYRVSIKKDKYRSAYSEEKHLIYTSSGLNKPQDLLAISVELQGIRLVWKDKSNYEESYKIEKDEGSGYTELTTLSANTESYLDAIPGMPPNPLQIKYRVKAYKSNVESDWTAISISYAGLGSPTDLKNTSASPSNFRIEWKDNSNIETGYSIERKKDTGTFTEIAQVGANTSFFSDKISEIGTYSYRIRTIKDGLYSSYSNIISKEITSLIPLEGLIGYWPFNGNANDESASRFSSTVYGANLITDRFGNSNAAYEFDGTDDYIYSGFSNKVFTTISVKFWLKSTSVNECMLVQSGFFFSYLGTFNVGKFIAGFDGNSTNNSSAQVCTTPINDGIWHCLVSVYNNSTTKLYIDGSLESTYTETIYPASVGVLYFGANKGIQSFYNGQLDDIRIYEKDLSLEEIQTLYHEGGWAE